MSKVQINNCSLANVHKFRCASPSGTSFCFLLGISFCIAGTQTGGFVFQRLCWLGEASIQVTSFHLGCHLLVFPSIFWENTCCNRQGKREKEKKIEKGKKRRKKEKKKEKNLKKQKVGWQKNCYNSLTNMVPKYTSFPHYI